MNIVNIVKNLLHQPFFVSLLAIMTVICYYYLKSQKKTYKKSIWIVYSLIFCFALVLFIGNAIFRIYHPQVWDFACSYLYGKTAAAGYNFYLPENLHTVLNSLNLPFSDYEGMIEVVVNVGFHFPPPTILLFFPLGFLSFKTALIVWTTFNMLFVYGCIFLIYEMFFKRFKLIGLMLVCVLLFILSPSLITINSSQTNFILLFLLLLLKKYSEKNVSGLFLALAIFIKPYMIIFALFFIIRKKFRTIGYFIISLFILAGITFVLIGKEPFVSYIFHNPTLRLPDWVYSESVNQSLHAVLLRSNLISLDTPITYTYIVAGIFFLLASFIFYLLRRQLYDYLLPVLLLIALLIYPGTLSHYGVLLLFIVFQFFDEGKQLSFSSFYLNMLVIGIFFYLTTIAVFASICFLLCIVVVKALNSAGRYYVIDKELANG